MRMRAQIDTVTLQPSGKWSVKFSLFGGEVGSESELGSCESSDVFSTEDDAFEGGNRALDHLEATGRFPNMCERW